MNSYSENLHGVTWTQNNNLSRIKILQASMILKKSHQVDTNDDGNDYVDEIWHLPGSNYELSLPLVEQKG